MSICKKLSIKVFTLSLLAAAFGFTSLHAQTVAYVTNFIGSTVSVIDTSTNTVTATIPVGTAPTGVVFSPDGTRAFVTNQGDGTVSVIDTASNTVVATVALASGSTPQLLAVTPDGKSLYVPDGNGVEVVSTATNSVSTTIPLGGAFVAAITPDGAHAYVGTSSGLFLIDTATNTVVGASIISLVVSNVDRPLAISPDGSHVYAVQGGTNNVDVIATASNTVVATIPLSQGSLDLAVTPDGSRVYATQPFASALNVIDTATNTVEPSAIAVGNFPGGLAITPDGASVYVVNQGDGTISAVSTATNIVVATVAVGSLPVQIAIANLSTPFADLTVTDVSTNGHKLSLDGSFTLSDASGGLDLAHQPLTLTVDTFSITIPAGSFKQVGGINHFMFHGTINGLTVDFDMKGAHGTSAIGFSVQIKTLNLSLPTPVGVTLKIGENSGSTTFPALPPV